jgi:5'-3' exonuclease
MLVLVSKFPNLAILVGKKMENICGTSTKIVNKKKIAKILKEKKVTHNE